MVEDAEIENLFLSEAEIGQPAVYYDGSHYVDGYGALAAYVIDSRIQNCGMGGTILTTSPVETEFLVAKASPAEAEELRGPGMERVPSIPEEGNTSTEVSGSGAQEAGPGMEAGGNGASGGESSDSDAGRETDAGPGVETDSQVESTSGENIPVSTEDAGPGSSAQESEQETSPSIGSGEGETNPVIQESSESGTENAGSGGSQPATDSAGGGTQATQPETGRPAMTQPETDQPATTQPETERPEVTQPETANPETDPPETAQPEAGQSEMAWHKTAQPESGLTRTAKNMLEPETIGYRANERDYLMMKVSAVIDADTAIISDATPSNATPTDAEEPFEESQNASGEDTGNADEEEIEYIGNPYGDIYILITADQVSVGGLIAQTAGDTQIQDSFAMVDINSELEDIVTYTGGLAGILGGETKTENSYVTGTVNGDDITGGFAAVNEGRIENCYSSISVGASGTSRGAFTAEGDGQLSGCVYDRQMACVDTEDIIQISGETAEAEIENGTETASEADFEREEPEFCLRGLDTIQMTGEDAQVPGRWHTTNQAYPQLEAFSQKEGGIAEIYSRASAIALILPEGTTLLDALSDSDILLPAEIDGAEILWEKEDGMGTNGAVLTPHEVPVLQQALAGGETGTGESDTGTADAGTASTSETDTETPESTAVEEPTPDIGETSGVPAVTFKATISNVTKIFAPVSQLAIEDEPVPADWSEVGKRVDTAGSSLESLKPEKNADGYYLIGSPEALAWFAYKVNTDNTNYRTAKALLTDDIDLAGLGYTKEPSVNSDFSNCLKWIPIGNDPSNNSMITTLSYRGIFDGGNCEIKNLYIIGGAYHAGFFGTANSATIRNVKIISGSVQGTDRVGGILGASNSGTVLIENCYNAANVKAVLRSGGTACNTGGIVGAGFNDAAQLYVKNCVNEGAISGYREVGGIIGTAFRGVIEIQNCYNLGTVTQSGTNHGTYGYGGIVGMGERGKTSNCYNAGAVIGSTNVHAISGGLTQGRFVINNSYFQTGFQGAVANGSNTVGLEEKVMKSWALAYKLNGEKMEGAWKYTEGEYPGFGTLDPALSWSVIAQGIRDGLITADEASTDSTGYLIDTPEKLALFAYDVNAGTKTTAGAKLTANIDLMGRKYGGIPDAPIRWTPIGTADNVYQGTFTGPSVIANMRVEQAGVGGLFGYVGSGAKLTLVGLDTSCSVTTTEPAAGGDSGTAALAGIIKNLAGDGPIYIESCYSRASVSGHSSYTGAIIGQSMGTLNRGYSNVISNSYAAGGLRTSSGTVGALAGYYSGDGNDGAISYSCWDNQASSAQSLNPVSQGSPDLMNVNSKTTTEMKSDAVLTLLNTGNNSWIRSDDRNNGYPSFSGAPAVYTSWEDVGKTVSEPSSRYPYSSITPGAEGNPYLVKSPEDLAWFAYQVNVEGRTSLCGELRSNINLYGSFYNGENAYNPDDSSAGLEKALRWVPIGSDVDGKRYTGTFNGNYHTITAMRASDTDKQGLFGTLGDNAAIRKTGILDSQINVSSAIGGGIAGYVKGIGVEITECGNKGSLSVTGSYIGSCVGMMDGTTGDLILDGCYNEGNISVSAGAVVGGIIGGVPGTTAGQVTIRNCMNSGTVTGNSVVGGIIAVSNPGAITVTGCWNAGTVSAFMDSSSAGSIIGMYSGSADDIRDCLVDETHKYGDIGNCLTVKPEALGTWGAAWRLNGGSFKQTTGLSWTYDKDSAYPVLSTTGLPPAESWEQVGEAMEYGLIKDIEKPSGNGSTTPYQIQNPEQLAWLAYKVNTDNTNYRTSEAVLTSNIDLAGLGYTKESSVDSDFSNCLKWVPIGNDPSNTSMKETLSYRGIFDGGNCEIKNLYVIGGVYYTGLFGGANSATIRNVKIISGSVTGTNRVGAILGASNGGTVLIENCYNAADIKAVLQNGFVACNTGGIVGAGFNASARLYVKNCVNKGAVSGYREGGGIIGTTHQGAIEIQNCYNLGTVTQIGTDHGTDGYGGIVGRGDCGKISNCYNAGAVIAESKVHAIAGTNPAAVVINNSYFQTGLQGAAANDSNTVGLEEEIIKSWPTAYALNEQSMTGPWKYTEGQYPDFGVLAPAGDWGIIGQGIEWGLIKNKKPTAGDGSAGSPYQISTPEALSWFACMVNSDTANQNWYGNLTTDISLVGTAYGGSSGAPIPWIPIGVYNGTDETKGYGGTFGTGHDRVYEIQNMHIKPAGFDRPGLFGQLTGTANISNIGMVDTVIESASDGSVMSAGSIAGRMMGTGTVISRCYSRNAEIHAGGVNGGVAGGITGGMESTSRIQDCYTMDSRILSTGTVATSSAFSASGIASSVPSGGTVKNCYAAGNTLTATKPGGEAGATYSIGNPVAAMAECYADNNTLGDKSKVKALEKTQAQADSLNTLDGSERQGDSRVWYTSLTAESTRGYPTFDKPVVLSVTVNPAEVTKNGATLNSSIGVWDGGVPPDGILFRAIHQEKRVNDGENQPAFHLTASSTVGDNFHIYGTDSSHEYLSVNVGNSDLASLASSLTDPTTALNTFQTSGSTQGLRVANGAAYIYPYDRILLLDLAVKNGSGGSSGITRYEVRIKVKAVTGKTLSVTMKTPVYITMEPGVTTTAYADDLVINNGNEYPVQFTVSSVEAIHVGGLASDNTRMDVELKPIASSVTIDDTKALTSQGIKLGITGPKTASDTGNLGTKKLYYTPSLGVDVPGTWMKADIAWNQSLGYRYFIDHSMLHIGPQQKFGFHITYQFSISNDDVAAVKVIEE